MSDPWWMDVREWSCWIEQTTFHTGQGRDGYNISQQTVTAQGTLDGWPINPETIGLSGTLAGFGRETVYFEDHHRGVNYLNPLEEQLEIEETRCAGPIEASVELRVGKITKKGRHFSVAISSDSKLPGSRRTTMDGVVVGTEDVSGGVYFRPLTRNYPLPGTKSPFSVDERLKGSPGSRLRVSIAPSKTVERPVDPLPPGHKRMDEKQKALWHGRFARMNVDDVIVVGERDWHYNCMAHTLDITAKPVWPELVPGAPTTLERLLEEYRAQGWEERPDGDMIAVYADPQGNVFHVSKVLPDGRHDSKCGSDLRLIHRPEDLEGGTFYPNVKVIRYISGKKQAVPQPAPGPAPKENLRMQRAQEAMAAGGHRVLLDRKPADGDLSALLAERMEPREARKLARELLSTIKSAEREAEFRRGMWENYLTRPSKARDYPVHYTIQVDSKEGNVGYPDWHVCKDKQCHENRRWPD